MFKFLSILLASLSGIAVVLAIIFEGKLKTKKVGNEFSKITKYGWGLIGILVIVGLGNVFTTHHGFKENEKQYKEDTLRYHNIISELKAKAVTDSIRIADLKQQVQNNGTKSDSIKKAVVGNAIKALEEQRKAVERERESIFLNFKYEIEDNLKKIFTKLTNESLDGFKTDTIYFISTRLSNEYIKKYKNITTSEIIVDFLMELTEYVDAVNMYANLATNARNDLQGKSTAINMLESKIKDSKRYMINIFSRIECLNSYKDYEAIDFSKEFTPYTDNDFLWYFTNDYLIKNGNQVN